MSDSTQSLTSDLSITHADLRQGLSPETKERLITLLNLKPLAYALIRQVSNSPVIDDLAALPTVTASAQRLDVLDAVRAP